MVDCITPYPRETDRLPRRVRSYMKLSYTLEIQIAPRNGIDDDFMSIILLFLSVPPNGNADHCHPVAILNEPSVPQGLMAISSDASTPPV